MSPRTGRPKVEKPRANIESIRLDDAGKEKLDICVVKTGLSKTEVLRKGLDLVYDQVIKK